MSQPCPSCTVIINFFFGAWCISNLFVQPLPVSDTGIGTLSILPYPFIIGFVLIRHLRGLLSAMSINDRPTKPQIEESLLIFLVKINVLSQMPGRG